MIDKNRMLNTAPISCVAQEPPTITVPDVLDDATNGNKKELSIDAVPDSVHMNKSMGKNVK